MSEPEIPELEGVEGGQNAAESVTVEDSGGSFSLPNVSTKMLVGAGVLVLIGLFLWKRGKEEKAEQDVIDVERVDAGEDDDDGEDDSESSDSPEPAVEVDEAATTTERSEEVMGEIDAFEGGA